MSNKKPKKSKKKQSASGVVMAILMLVGMVGVFLMPTSIMLTIGMLPTLVAALVDRTPEKTAGLTVGSMNLAGVLPFLIDLWQGGHTVEKSIYIITGLNFMVIAWACAGMGWLIYFNVPHILAKLARGRSEGHIKRLQKEQKELVDAWGMEVTQDLPVPEEIRDELDPDILDDGLEYDIEEEKEEPPAEPPPKEA